MSGLAAVTADAKQPEWWTATRSQFKNCGQIAFLLEPYLAEFKVPAPVILEVGSGFGRQIATIAQSGDHCLFQPTEIDKDLCREINGATAPLKDYIFRAEQLDITAQGDWLKLVHKVSAKLDKVAAPGRAEADAYFHGVISINLTHVTPWKVTQELFSHLDARINYDTNLGQKPLLSPTQGIIVIYGPFKVDGIPEDDEVEAAVRAENPEYGLSDIQNDLVPLAKTHGYRLAKEISMPLANHTLIFKPIQRRKRK